MLITGRIENYLYFKIKDPPESGFYDWNWKRNRILAIFLLSAENENVNDKKRFSLSN